MTNKTNIRVSLLCAPIAFAILLSCSVLSAAPVAAQQTTQEQPAAQVGSTANTGAADTTQVAADVDSPKRIGFRLPEWKSLHVHDADQLAQLTATFEKLGCEVQQNAHNGHTDLSFRCANWQSLTLENYDQVQQWKSWLDQHSFESLVINPPVDATKPTVQFRLADWMTMHLHEAGQVESFSNTFKMLGCEVETANHGNHIDAKIRCAQWVTIQLPSEQSAHTWQGWLQHSGFETKHEHAHAPAAAPTQEASQANAAGAESAGGDAINR